MRGERSMVNTNVIIVTLILVIAMLAEIVVYAWRYKKIPPDKAMVVYGRRMNPRSMTGYRMMSGGGKFILPIVEDVKFMDVGLRSFVLEVDNLRTDPRRDPSGIGMSLVVNYRVSVDRDGLAVAAEHLLGKPNDEIEHIAKVNLAGHVRGVAATMTSDEIDLDRETFEGKMLIATQDLQNVGIEVLTLRIIRVHIMGAI